MRRVPHPVLIGHARAACDKIGATLERQRRRQARCPLDALLDAPLAAHADAARRRVVMLADELTATQAQAKRWRDIALAPAPIAAPRVVVRRFVV